MPDQRAELEWREDAVPVSTRFDDPYFSLQDGLAETRHVFLDGNGLPGRFRDGFHVAELGFGTGLNFLTTVLAWRQAGAPGRLRFTSFEGWPMRAAEMARALAPFPELVAVAEPLLAGWGAGRRVIAMDPGIELQVIVGDARDTLPGWAGRADAWFLDGFSPARNPELWGADLMAQVGAHT
ncbi:tRNA (5-methylaminomethyl-2-thiouridine)(34)-methyltransferase MnmD, partial [Roseovarius sp. SYSU LYC5161]|uniref:tRNA (5-methylaminomethyl-2-thiouridine)(34)-methyltransferase MnmD n=1 Tax=Roseovarius halophilus (ex Wu et al. 2025) TaxID=3376060 RepID=UPI00399AEA87